jgi:hypothetical protein
MLTCPENQNLLPGDDTPDYLVKQVKQLERNYVGIQSSGKIIATQW